MNQYGQPPGLTVGYPYYNEEPQWKSIFLPNSSPSVMKCVNS
ncbi:hypothetical protein SAMN05216256_10850 [Halopseudomonas pachastrellae]|jgi:hypothetical protein|nr:hypothetical protein SAMN05216256_10850 [Halopseudomonas pachastrellae]